MGKYVKIRSKDPEHPNEITQQSEAETKGAIFQSTGRCTLTGHLPKELVYQGQNISLVTYVNNAECKKMVKKTRVSLHRKMTAKGHTTQGEEKEWKDEQVIFIREYDSLVAVQDPNIAT